jgi:pimeloyl-ACP methyl ester carboxylesterase
MQFFDNDGFDLSFLDSPSAADGEPVLLIHGFASSVTVNWIEPSWTRTLNDAGYRVIAFDNRGHGRSRKSRDPADYVPEAMAGDAVALMDRLGVERAHVFGYSMGARISAFLALSHPGRVATLVFGGLGYGMVEGVGDWGIIARALLAEDPGTIEDPRGQAFRTFADRTGSDRIALAACIETSRKPISEADMASIQQPTLIGVGTRDDIAGSAARLAGIMPNATAFDIERRDHMQSVGDRSFKARVLDFLKEHPL